jgi:hypothetical protein
MLLNIGSCFVMRHVTFPAVMFFKAHADFGLSNPAHCMMFSRVSCAVSSLYRPRELP